jgi:DNA helicase II / ATP-dependent DNA helicase PcrA
MDYEQIVTNFSSPTLILAGPGAGKTYLLADRVKRLLNLGKDKSKITVLTFGKDASQHMRKELIDPEGKFKIESSNIPNISTMHSLGLSIVQEKPKTVNLHKIELKVQNDEHIKKLMYRDAALILGYTEEDSRKALKCKQCGDCQKDNETKQCKICKKYWEIMSKCNCVDFDDQILFACQVLENNPDILRKYQNQAEHLLVDEYQDINTAQFKLIEMLSRNARQGLFAVGDDAQTIYAFRGSSTKFILRFAKDFSGANTPPLAHSRRCHKKIIDDAVKVLEKYYTDWTGKQELEFHVPSGEEPVIWQLPSETAEAEMVARVAQFHVKKKKSVLILAPKKDFFRLISKKLYEYNVPHDCPINLLPEAVNKRVAIAKRCLDWVSNPTGNFMTRLVVEDLINTGIAKVPGANKNRRCTKETLINRTAEEARIAKLWESVNKETDLFSVIKGLNNPCKIMKKIQDSLLKLLECNNNSSGNNKGEFLKQLSIITGIWTDPSNFITDFTSMMDILESSRPTGPAYVQLMTMKKAKGLEADVVFIIGLEDDIIPNPQNDLIEEARLFYVSMTRAKKELYLFHAYKRPRNISYGDDLTNKKRSKFLDAIGRASEYKTVTS